MHSSARRKAECALCIAYSGDGDEVLIGEHLKQEVRGQLHEAERLPERAAAPALVEHIVNAAREPSVPVFMFQAHVSIRMSTSFAPVIANWYLQVRTRGHCARDGMCSMHEHTEQAAKSCHATRTDDESPSHCRHVESTIVRLAHNKRYRATRTDHSMLRGQSYVQNCR